MSGLVLHSGAIMTCPHGGQVSITTSQTRAQVGGTPIATSADQLTVAGCPGVPASPTPPCTLVTWTNMSTRVLANSSPVLLQSPTPGPVPGNGTVVGPPPPAPLVMSMQIRVQAT